MNLFSFMSFLFCVFIFHLSQFSQCETNILPNDRQLYSVIQLVEDIVNNLQPPQTLYGITDLGENKLSSSPSEGFFNSPFLDSLKIDETSRCALDLNYTFESLKTKGNPNLWAWQWIDSFGKPESGILEGNAKWLGDFDQCRNVHAPKTNNSDVGGFQGQYCSLLLNIGNKLNVSSAVCFPESCSTSEILYFVQKLLDHYWYIPYLSLVSATNVTSCVSNERKLTNGAIATICILTIFIMFVLMGSFITALKYVMSFNSSRSKKEKSINYDTEKSLINGDDGIVLITEGSRTKTSVFIEKTNSFLNCFCFFTNGSKLLNTDATEGQMLCIHGIRFLSMSWVIVCHTYAFGFGSVRNLRGILTSTDNWPFQVILNGFFSVDSFFVLSAFLMTYLYLKEVAKKDGKVPWLYFYVHRYLRLTPVYMLILAFYATLFTYVGSGPLWPTYDTDPACQQSWWWNILYINNFRSSQDMCLGWSWYLANDMQFFVISPFFLITLWRWPKVGFALLGSFIAGSCISAFVISYEYTMFTGLGDLNNIKNMDDFKNEWADYFEKLYIKPYARIGPYLVGIALGYYLFKREASKKPKISYVNLCLGWIIASALALACVYGLYHNKLGSVGASFYNGFSRSCYGACLCWVIFVCLIGQGGAVNKILSYKLFIPLSRMTYCAYLIHPMVLIGYFSSLRASIDFSHSTMVVSFLGLLLVTYAISFVASLVLESPIIRLEKFLRAQFSS